ncbi:MAG: UDP-3-O-acyl-N-acetylglucosamine deacetylase [Pseudomonadota bacterium]
MRFQTRQTLKEPVSFHGVGLHSGAPVTCTVRPANPDTGLLFRRLDLLTTTDGAVSSDGSHLRVVDDANLEAVSVPARATQVSATRLGTTLTNPYGVSVATVEHLLAALALCQLDDAIIDLDAGEVPILDGSADDFVTGFHAAGFAISDQPRRYWRVDAPVEVALGDRTITVTPAPRFELNVAIDFADPLIAQQAVSLAFEDDKSRTRLAKARTFCELETVRGLQAHGLCQGGSLDNALIVDKGRLMNKGTLRDPQEFALHKALDLLGDLYLMGMPILGRVTALKPGHEVNTRLAKTLADHPGAIITLEAATAPLSAAQ